MLLAALLSASASAGTIFFPPDFKKVGGTVDRPVTTVNSGTTGHALTARNPNIAFPWDATADAAFQAEGGLVVRPRSTLLDRRVEVVTEAPFPGHFDGPGVLLQRGDFGGNVSLAYHETNEASLQRNGGGIPLHLRFFSRVDTSSRHRFLSTGSAANDSTQDGVTIQPSGVLSAFWRPLAIYTSSLDTSPSAFFDSSARLATTAIYTPVNTITSFQLQTSGNVPYMNWDNVNGDLRWFDNPIFGTGDFRFIVKSGVRPLGDNVSDVGSLADRWRTGRFGTSVVVGSSTYGSTKATVANTTAAPFNVVVLAADPAAPTNGDVWVFDNGLTRAFRFRSGGVTYSATAM